LAEDAHQLDVRPAPPTLRPLYVLPYWQVVDGLYLFEWIVPGRSLCWVVASLN
jgi:hypothetical protein